MLPYNELYNRIVNIVRLDYAGFLQRKQWNMAAAHSKVTMMAGRGSDGVFFREAREYIDGLMDPNLWLLNTRRDGQADYSRGFAVRAAGDTLFVTALFGAEGELSLGDEIVELGGQSVAQFRAALRAPRLYGESPERELWGNTIRCIPNYVVRRKDGTEVRAELSRAPHEGMGSGSIRLKKLPGETLLIQVSGLVNRSMAEDFVVKNDVELGRCGRRIFDLRNASTVDDSDLFPLLPYVCSGGAGFLNFLHEHRHFINYSRGNCALLRAHYMEAAKALEDRGADSAFVASLFTELAEKEGKGFLEEENEELAEAADFMDRGKAPAKTILLTDLFCRDGAEILAALCKACGEVQIVGRPSLGTMDYRMNMAIALDETATLLYPLAITRAAYEGRGLGRKGLSVDVYVPWSQAEIFEDLVLQKAMEIS